MSATRAIAAFLTSACASLAGLAGTAVAADPTPALTASVTKGKVKVELAADVTAVAPGETFRLGVYLRPDPEWHVYWKFAGDTGLPTEVQWVGPDGVDFGALAWPRPLRLPDKVGGRAFGYDHEVLLTSEVRVPNDALEGSEIPLEAKVDWLVCRENCIQGSAHVGLKLPVRQTPIAERRSTSAPSFDAWAGRVPLKAPPAGWKVTSAVAGGPVAPGGAFTATLTVTADGPVAPADPVIESFFPGTEGLEVSDVALKAADSQGDPKPDPATLALTLGGHAAQEGGLVSRLEGVVTVRRDGKPVSFDVVIDVPRVAGPASATGATGATGTPPLTSQVPRPAAPSLGAAVGDDPCEGADASSGGDDRATSFLAALALAFLGGLILNGMPCVLPVLSLKVMGIVEQAKEEPRVIWRHGLAYTGGVLTCFLVFAIVLAALHETWAFQFRDPTFVAIFTAIVFAFGLSLFGVFEIAMPGASRIDAAVAGSHGYWSSFNYGVFAVLLGTPCTAPFLSPALTFASTQPPFEMTVLLLMVGLGLAFPFLVIARFPAWRRYLPKPGAWLLTFKKIMGFLLIGAAVFMLSIFAAQVSREALIAYLVFLSLLSLALWIYGHWTEPSRTTRTRLVATAVALGLTIAAATTLVSTEAAPPPAGSQVINGVTWYDFDQSDVEAEAREGRLVFIDFTATWCTTCKVNEALAIHTDASKALFERLAVFPVKADFTTKKPKIEEWLARFAEPSVPMYIVIPPGRPAEAFKLGQLLSEGDVRDGVCRAHRLVTAAQR